MNLVPKTIHQAALQACANLMLPIANFLLKHGVSYREFADIARWAFVKVASTREANNERTPTVTRIASSTGLSRKDVAHILQRLTAKEIPGMRTVSSAGRILEIWHRFPEYLDSVGKPAAIPIRGPKVSFFALSELANSSIPPDQMLDELERAGSVERTEDEFVRAKDRYFVAPAGHAELVKRFGLRVRDLATTINYNNEQNSRESRLFEASAICLRLEPRFLPLCKRMISEGGLNYLQQVDSWFASHEVDSESSENVARVGVGVYFFQEPTETDPDPTNSSPPE